MVTDQTILEQKFNEFMQKEKRYLNGIVKKTKIKFVTKAEIKADIIAFIWEAICQFYKKEGSEFKRYNDLKYYAIMVVRNKIVDKLDFAKEVVIEARHGEDLDELNPSDGFKEFYPLCDRKFLRGKKSDARLKLFDQDCFINVVDARPKYVEEVDIINNAPKSCKRVINKYLHGLKKDSKKVNKVDIKFLQKHWKYSYAW